MFAPYLLGGVGLYRRKYDDVSLSTQPVTLSTEQKFGLHLGVGAEIFLGRHAAIFADYRFRFVKFGDPGVDDQPDQHSWQLVRSGTRQVHGLTPGIDVDQRRRVLLLNAACTCGSRGVESVYNPALQRHLVAQSRG